MGINIVSMSKISYHKKIISGVIPIVFCKCGCGLTRPLLDNKLRTQLYLTGHALRNRPSNRKGQPCSDIHKLRIGKANTGKKHSDKTKEEMSKSRKGRKLTEETKRKIGLKSKGNTHNLGRKASEETKLRQSNAQIKSHLEHPERAEKQRQARLHQVFPMKDSKIEKQVQLALKIKGIEFRKHESIFGQPDIFIEPNICIFVDGCYFHCCSDCYSEKVLSGKIPQKALIRDTKVNHKLNELGYQVIRIWEHTINNSNIDVANTIIGMINPYKKGTLKVLE